VVATIPVGNNPLGVAVTPDGAHAYVANHVSDNVSVIDMATNMVVATVPVGTYPKGVAVTPDGKHAYVTNITSRTVSMIATATNTVVATVPVGANPTAVAVTPDGKHACVVNFGDGTVSVIDTATNTVVATVAVGARPTAVAIVPPPPGIPFLIFNAKPVIQFGSVPNHDAFGLGSSFTLSSTDSNGINPPAEAVTLQVGTFTTIIPPGSFKKNSQGSFTFTGVIGGVSLEALIKPTGTLRYALLARAKGANLAGTKNAVFVTLTIGGDSGAASVTAAISP
jgi:YVTN family beta-propeller protein